LRERRVLYAVAPRSERGASAQKKKADGMFKKGQRGGKGPVDGRYERGKESIPPVAAGRGEPFVGERGRGDGGKGNLVGKGLAEKKKKSTPGERAGKKDRAVEMSWWKEEPPGKGEGHCLKGAKRG